MSNASDFEPAPIKATERMAFGFIDADALAEAVDLYVGPDRPERLHILRKGASTFVSISYGKDCFVSVRLSDEEFAKLKASLG